MENLDSKKKMASLSLQQEGKSEERTGRDAHEFVGSLWQGIEDIAIQCLLFSMQSKVRQE